MKEKYLSYNKNEEIFSNVAEKPNNEFIDLSTNINPLGLPDKVKSKLIKAIDLYTCYPDSFCKELSILIAKKRGIKPEQVLCSSGADDLIYRIAYAVKPKKALILAPTFEEYEKALKNVDCEVIYYFLEEKSDFLITESLFKILDASIDIIYICNPNNPTGQLLQIDLLLRLLEYCEQNDILLVIDECFNGFLDESLLNSARKYIDKYNNLIVLEAFTKLYAMAGLRLGFCMSNNNALLKQIYKSGQAYSVSVPAQVAGITALRDEDYLVKTKAWVSKERKYMKEELTELGINVIGSYANYLFFRSPIAELRKKLNDFGILIRNCDEFHGLNGEFCRIALKTHKENKVFIDIIKKLL